jgi:hypothetical protein
MEAVSSTDTSSVMYRTTRRHIPEASKVSKVKISLLQAMKAHWVARGLRLPHYLDKRLIDGGKVVSPTRQPHFTPKFLYFFKDSWYSFLLKAESTPGPVRPEGLGQFKKIHQIGT